MESPTSNPAHPANSPLHGGETACRTLIDAMDEGYVLGDVLYDADGSPADILYLEANPAAHAIVGLPVAGRRLSQFTPTVEPRWLELLSHVARTGQNVRLEEYITPLNKWFDCYVFRPDPANSRRFAAVFRDVTERKRADAALRASEQRFRLFVQNVREYAFVQVDPTGLVTSWNPGAERLFGYTKDEMLGRHASRLLTPEERQAGVFEKEFALVATGARNEDTRWLVRKNGACFWVRCITEPVYDETGRLRGFAKVLRDETERRQAEEALRESERQFEIVANLVPDLLWRNTPEAKAIWCNQRWLEYTGQTTQQAQGFGWLNTIHPEDRAASLASLHHAFANGQSVRREHRIRAADGQYRWFLVQELPVRDKNGRITQWLGAATDIHDQRAALEALQVSLSEKEVLLKEVHHRVKNNLQVITSLLNLQAGQVEDRSVLTLFEETRNRVQSIACIHELLYQSSSLAAIDLAAYARRLVSDLVRFYGVEGRVRAEIGGNNITLPLDRAVPYGLLLNELASNSLKHGFSKNRKGQLIVVLRREADRITLVVADTGIGLPPGFNYDAASTLGLKLVHLLTRQLHGTVKVVPSPGTAVEVCFPIEPKQAEDEE